MNLVQGIIDTANSIGMDPAWLATIISYESGFNPNAWGGSGGRHYGLIQFGPAERAQFGVREGDVSSQLGPNGGIAKYFRVRGWQPGMSFQDAYSIVNAGSPGRGNASDAANGGMPGTVAQKVVSPDMQAHAQKAAAFLGGKLTDPSFLGGQPQPGFQMPAAQQEQPVVEMPILPGQDPYKDPNLLTDTAIQSSYGGGAAQAKAEGVPQAFDEPTDSPLGEMFARATPETPMFDTRLASPTLTQPNQVDLSQGLAEVFKLKPYGQAGIDKATGLPNPRRRTYG